MPQRNLKVIAVIMDCKSGAGSKIGTSVWKGIGVAILVGFAGAGAHGDEVTFNRDIRNILSNNCYPCHGPDADARKAKLRLDLEAEAKRDRGGYRVIDTAHPEESEILLRIRAADPDDRMPPADSGKHLTPSQIDLLARWIEQGAEYEGHWAYLPPRRTEPPAVEHADRVRNSIDRFILARVEAAGIEPAPEADRRRLVRRVALDLTGLPPTREMVEEFLGDRRPDAYARLVDRLVESPHFGERMAVPWLDLARFADTVGYHGDQQQNVFPYRDYVIAAFNQNKPFDEFTVEQLAGDLLPNPTAEQLVATGFNRLNMMTREGGAQAKEYLAKYAADRVRTVSTTWMATTMGCAECHDHKFDPFTARDFYSMSAFFADIKQWGVYGDYGYLDRVPELKGFNNHSPFPPELQVENDYLQQKLRQKREEVHRLIRGIAARQDMLSSREQWRRSIRAFLALRPSGWTRPAVEAVESDQGTKAELQDDGSLAFFGPARSNEKHRITLRPLPGTVAVIRLEVLPTARHENQVARDGRTQFSLRLEAVHLPAAAEADKESQIAFHHAYTDSKKTVYSMGLPVQHILNGWTSPAGRSKEAQSAIYHLEHPLAIAAGDRIVLTLTSAEIGCVRISTSPLVPGLRELEVPAEAVRTAVEADSAELNRAAEDMIARQWFAGTAPDADRFARFRTLQQEILDCREGRAMTMVVEAREPRPVRILPRGNWQDESGPLVTPAIPEIFRKEESAPEHRLNRLDLARWLVSPDNPLTARVFVNRLWEQFFGTGLSAVLDDVGSQGEWPTHPELLDWLAMEFMESGWNIKHMVKLIVLSGTYRQSSNPSPDQVRKDPKNRLLARQSPLRLEAEFVRDNALAVSGLLNEAIGGPSIRPYQPAGYYANLNFPSRVYRASSGEAQYRRGLYMHWQRTFLHPMLANFDAPSREECTADRTVSNTPQQALTLMNDPTFFEAARAFAASLLQSPPDRSFESRLQEGFERALARPPRATEQTSLRNYLAGRLEYYQNHPDDAAAFQNNGNYQAPPNLDRTELAAWTELCRVLLNLHETITRL